MQKSILVYPRSIQNNFEKYFSDIIPRESIVKIIECKDRLSQSIVTFFNSKNISDNSIHVQICNASKEYLKIFNTVYTFLSDNRNSIYTKRFPKNNWKFYNNKYYNPISWNSWNEYNFEALIAEGICAVCCLCFSRYNLVILDIDKLSAQEKKELLVKAIKDCRYVWANFILEWKTKEELELPFEMTSTGISFYRKLFESSLLHLYYEDVKCDFENIGKENLLKITPVLAKITSSTAETHASMMGRLKDNKHSNMFVDPIATEEMWNRKNKTYTTIFTFVMAICISDINHSMCVKLCNRAMEMIESGTNVGDIEENVKKYNERKNNIYHTAKNDNKDANIDDFIDGKIYNLSVNYLTIEKKAIPLVPLIELDNSLYVTLMHHISIDK